MKTTLDLNDALLRAAKKLAVDARSTLTSVIEEALRRYLSAGPRAKQSYRFRPKTFGSDLRPGVDLHDRDALYDKMEGRR